MSEKTGGSQSGGINISGNVGPIHGDMVGRDKVTFNFGPRSEEVAGEVIRQTEARRTETVDISGRWADATGSIFEITQTGNTFHYASLNQQNGLRSEGTGRIDGHRFNTTYRTNVPSQGTATGTVSDSGLEIIETVLRLCVRELLSKERSDSDLPLRTTPSKGQFRDTLNRHLPFALIKNFAAKIER